MKIVVKIASLVIFFSSQSAQSQIKLPVLNDSLFGTYYQQRVNHFKLMPVKQDDIVSLAIALLTALNGMSCLTTILLKTGGSVAI